jgi:hypothetical protein
MHGEAAAWRGIQGALRRRPLPTPRLREDIVRQCVGTHTQASFEVAKVMPCVSIACGYCRDQGHRRLRPQATRSTCALDGVRTLQSQRVSACKCMQVRVSAQKRESVRRNLQLANMQVRRLSRTSCGILERLAVAQRSPLSASTCCRTHSHIACLQRTIVSPQPDPAADSDIQLPVCVCGGSHDRNFVRDIAAVIIIAEACYWHASPVVGRSASQRLSRRAIRAAAERPCASAIRRAAA